MPTLAISSEQRMPSVFRRLSLLENGHSTLAEHAAPRIRLASAISLLLGRLVNICARRTVLFAGLRSLMMRYAWNVSHLKDLQRLWSATRRLGSRRNRSRTVTTLYMSPSSAPEHP